jgi:hypothetical protein
VIIQDHLPQAATNHVPRRTAYRRFLGTTPGRLTTLATAALVAATVLAALVTIQTGRSRAAVTDIGDYDAPEAAATTDLYFVLNDMDAQVANILLVGDATDLGFTATQAQAIFEQRRLLADTDLQKAAVAATDPATAQSIRAVLDAYGRYQTLVARTLLLDSLHPHPAGHPDSGTVAAYRLATDLLDDTLLPAARNLEERSAAALSRTYLQQNRESTADRTAVATSGLVGVILMITAQVFLARRFRRRLNPAMLAATLALIALAGAGVLLPTLQAGHLRVAKQDAFDSIQALDQARAVSYDANADESRYLVDPGRADQYQNAFLTKTQQLVDLPGAGIDTYDADLAAAITRYQRDHADIDWTGLYGTEFRNITFTGERAAAERVLQLFAVYQADDRRIRGLVSAGELGPAIAFCTSYQPGQSNDAFTQYDHALTALIAINQTAFTANVAATGDDLRGWTLIPWLILPAIAVLLAAGVWPRLAEYR